MSHQTTRIISRSTRSDSCFRAREAETTWERQDLVFGARCAQYVGMVQQRPDERNSASAGLLSDNYHNIRFIALSSYHYRDSEHRGARTFVVLSYCHLFDLNSFLTHNFPEESASRAHSIHHGESHTFHFYAPPHTQLTR